MPFLNLFSNPIWRARGLIFHSGDANAPAVWQWDANGFVSGANNRPLSAQEIGFVNEFNAGRAELNLANRNAIDDLMGTVLPLSDGLYKPLSDFEATELTSHLSWLMDYENGSDFYADTGNYDYYPSNPDSEADYRCQRLTELIDKSGADVDTEPVQEKVWHFSSPIVIDLDGDGIDTSSLLVEKSVVFDLNADGIKDRTAWLSGRDAFLAIDKNGNGIIDDSRELFGGDVRGEGFAKLIEFDSNGDGEVNSTDEKFSELLLWQDINSDGITDSGELQIAGNAGLESIGVNYIAQNIYESGNLLGEVSTAIFQNREVDAVDVYFKYNAGEMVTSSDSNILNAAPLISAMAEFAVPGSAENRMTALDSLSLIDIAIMHK